MRFTFDPVESALLSNMKIPKVTHSGPRRIKESHKGWHFIGMALTRTAATKLAEALGGKVDG